MRIRGPLAREQGALRWSGLVLILIFVGLLSLVALYQRAPRGHSAERLLERLVQTRRPGCVFDYAEVIHPNDAAAMEQFLRQTEVTTGMEIKVVTLKSLEGGDIDDFANKLFERWGIGKKGKDNGVLLLAVINDRYVRIEVGYGLEPILTDGLAGRLLDEYVLPAFQRGDYSTGLRQGVEAIVRVLRGQGNEEESASMPHSAPRVHPVVGLLRVLFLIFVVAFIIRHPFLAILLFSRGASGPHRGGFGGGGFGGGGFGGGWSGGGGASRRW